MTTNNNHPSYHTPFQQALIDSILKDYDAILSSASQVQSSSKMNEWMQRKIQKAKRQVTARKTLKTILIAAIITALLAISAFAAPAIRAALIRFFLAENNDHYIITFDPEQAATAPLEIQVSYDIYYIPADYMLVAEHRSTISNVAIWASSNGKLILYSQRIMPQDAQAGSWIGLDHKGELRTKTLEDYVIVIVPAEETDIWVWTDNAYVFTLEFPNDLQESEVEKIFANWRVSPPT